MSAGHDASRRGSLAAGLTTAIALLLAWELADRGGIIALDMTARPTEIGRAWWGLATGVAFWRETAHTIWVFALSWTVAVVGGAAMGLALGWSRPAARLLQPTVTFLRFIPPPALVPVVLILWGFSQRSEITIAVFAAIWPVMINTAAGAAEVDARLLDVGRLVGMGRLRQLRTFVLPATLPMLVTGARIAASICLIVVVTAEMLGVPYGLGYEIVRSTQTLQPADAFAYVMWTGALGLVVNILVRRSQRAILPWHAAGGTT